MKSQPFAARPRSTERASCLYARVQSMVQENLMASSPTNFVIFFLIYKRKKDLKKPFGLRKHDARVSRDSLARIGVSSSLRFR